MTAASPTTRYRGLGRRLAFTVAFLLVSAVAVTWAWNTIVADLADIARFRFGEGLAVAFVTLFLGALFGAGWRLADWAASTRPTGRM